MTNDRAIKIIDGKIEEIEELIDNVEVHLAYCENEQIRRRVRNLLSRLTRDDEDL